ncbi:hypothetical protein HIM_09573 [Hirsutella minnesotensis 3608]|uniref:Phytocyanin domain-containing protein n=1 Tax=Hirsutella minnesotensis 3608 TaxID=1043627 RepID=A0A0F7ZGK4_9HYPO|nr:hypothetical protein HIM_09573 [Hirsutella minnesotensis 3608]
MRISQAIAVVAGGSAVLAQPGPAAFAGLSHMRRQLNASAEGGGKMHTVLVGGPQQIFMPNAVMAEVGDMVQFQFSSGSHTVTESSENEGCTPLQKQNPEAVHSGPIPFKPGQPKVGTFTIKVARKEPMFLYCATGMHCQRGQVMVINPTNPQQIAKYAEVSSKAKENVGGDKPSGGEIGEIDRAQSLIVEAPPKAGPGGAEGAGKGGAGAAGEKSGSAGAEKGKKAGAEKEAQTGKEPGAHAGKEIGAPAGAEKEGKLTGPGAPRTGSEKGKEAAQGAREGASPQKSGETAGEKKGAGGGLLGSLLNGLGGL